MESKRLKEDPLLQWISEGDGSDLDLTSAIDAYNTFVQLNFTGPPLPDLPRACTDISLWDRLNVGNNKTTLLAELPQLLSAAISTFERLSSPIWLGRALILQQSLLKDLSVELESKVFQCFSKENIEDYCQGKTDLERSAMFAEAARAHLVFDDDEPAESLLHQARETSGLIFEITGVQGTITKFQAKPTLHLICVAHSRKMTETPSTTRAGSQIPENLKLNSDLLHETPQLQELSIDSQLPKELKGINPTSQPPLTSLDCALLLLQAEHWIQRNPSFKDPLVAQQVLAYVQRVVQNKNHPTWSVYSRALWMRSELEAEAIHTVERSTLQMESIVNSVHSASNAVDERLEYFNLLLPVPKWQLDKTLVDRLMAVGSAESAIPVYTRLRRFADASLCYAVLGDKEKAISVLDDHLTKNSRDARAWAIKGDITRDPTFWEKAWEIGKYPAAQRSLGRFYFNPPPDSGQTRDVQKARQALELAVQADAYHFDALFILGCIYMEQEEWAMAARTFQQCASLQNDDIKSWTNLAGALIQLDRFEPALHALREAMRVNRNSEPNWKVWTNYMTMATRMDAWDDVVSALRQLTTLQVLPPSLPSVIAEAAVAFTSTQVYDSGSGLHVAFCDIICAKIPPLFSSSTFGPSNIWKVVALIEKWRKRPWAALSAHEKGFEMTVKRGEFQEKVNSYKDLISAYRSLSNLPGRVEGSTVCRDWKTKARKSGQALKEAGKAEALEKTESYQLLLQLIEGI